MDKLDSIAALITEAKKVLGGYQEIADGIIIRKVRAPRKKTTRKAREPAVKKSGTGLSAQLKACRKKAGLNQEALAKKLGVKVASVRAWEYGRSNPRKARKPRKVAKTAPKGGGGTGSVCRGPEGLTGLTKIWV